MISENIYDCIIIGAGPAGLSAALFLARYHHRILVFHHNSPRNIYSHGVHGFLGHDGILPSELLARGRQEVEQYGGIIIEGCVTKAEQLADHYFRVAVSGEANVQQSWEAHRLLLATGLRDFTPDCPGFREFYGQSVFHCPDCDGYEVTGKRVAVLGTGEKTFGFTLNLLTWTPHLTVITDSKAIEMLEDFRTRLGSFGIGVLDQPINRLEGDVERGQLKHVCFEDGTRLECDALFFNLGTEPASDLHEMLSCKLDPESGLLWVDSNQQTSIPGIYAAGDLTPHSQLVIVAAAEGAMAGINIHKSLLPPEQRV